MIVIDANVVLAALRSANGASYVLLRKMIAGEIAFAISPAVVLEYEDVLKRPGILGDKPWIKSDELDVILDAVFQKALLVSPYFRFRPFLEDPKDDLYVECVRRRCGNDHHERSALLSSVAAGIRIDSLQCGHIRRGSGGKEMTK